MEPAESLQRRLFLLWQITTGLLLLGSPEIIWCELATPRQAKMVHTTPARQRVTADRLERLFLDLRFRLFLLLGVTGMAGLQGWC